MTALWDLERFLAGAATDRVGLSEIGRGSEQRGRESSGPLSTTGVTVPKRSAELIVLEASVDFDAFYIARWRDAFTVDKGEVLIGAVDAKGMPMVKPVPPTPTVRLGTGEKRNKKRMATVGTVFSTAPRVRTAASVIDSLFATAPADRDRPTRQRPTHKRVWASLLAGKDNFIADVKAEMTRRGPLREHPWVIVTECERALQRRVNATLEDVTLVLDLLHVLEKTLGRRPRAAPPRQRSGRRLRLTTSPTYPLRPSQRRCPRPAPDRHETPDERAKSEDAARRRQLLLNNRSRMRYHEYLAYGWSIASDWVEGACENLVRDRLRVEGLAGMPRAVGAGVVEALLGSCDTITAVGRRDAAILMVPARLGLRGGEVAGLKFDDIEW